MAVTPGFFGVFQGVMLTWLLSTGLVLPVGLPPGPEDPVVANVAPEECLYYMGWASMAKPDPKSTNRLEQLFAEPEIQQIVATAQRCLRESLSKSMGGGGSEPNPMVDDAIWLAKKAIASPGAIYVRSAELRGQGQPGIQAGAILGLGDDAAKVRGLLEKYAAMIPPGQLERIKIREEPFYRIKLGADSPVIALGILGNHLVIGADDAEAEALLKRMAGKPPEWLSAVRQRLVVERPAVVSYVNVRKIVQIARAAAGPQADPVIAALDLENCTAYAAVSGLDKDGYVSRSLLAMEKPGGLFLGGKPLEAKDLAAVPRDATWAGVAKFDPDQLWQTIVAAVGKASPPAAQQLAQAVEQVEKRFQFKLREDLLQPLSGTWSIYNSPGEGGFLVTGVTVVGQLNDAKRAKATHDRLLAVMKDLFEQLRKDFRVNDLKLPIRQFACAGQQVYMLELPWTLTAPLAGPGPSDAFPWTPTWCLTDKDLVIALFPQNVKAYLLRGPDYQSLATRPEVAAMLASGPAAMSYVDEPELFRTFYPLLQVGVQSPLSELRRQGIDVDRAIFPSAPTIGKHLRPAVTAVRRTSDGIETTRRQSIPGTNIASAAPMMAAMLVPAVQAAREAARRTQCANNLKQIGLALLNYENANNAFPAAYSVDKNGKPLLSWRVAILPYLERSDLYEQFHLDEPWDSANNKKLIPLMPPIFRCPDSEAAPGKTTYLTVRGKDTVFPGDKGIALQDITDGTSFTILVVDASDKLAVDWTKPDDFTPDAKDPVKGLSDHHPNGFNVIMADCSVHFLSESIDLKVLQNLFTRNDGQAIDSTDLEKPARARPASPDVKKPVPPSTVEKKS